MLVLRGEDAEGKLRRRVKRTMIIPTFATFASRSESCVCWCRSFGGVRVCRCRCAGVVVCWCRFAGVGWIYALWRASSARAILSEETFRAKAKGP